MFIFSKSKKEIINAVAIAATKFINLWTVILFLIIISRALNSINPTIAPEILVIKSVTSKAPIFKTNCSASNIKLTKKKKKNLEVQVQ